MMTSSLSLVGPNRLHALKRPAKAAVAAKRASRLPGIANHENVTKPPRTIDCSIVPRPSGLESKSIKTVTGLADGADVGTNLDTIRHIVERVVAERQIL